MQKLIDNLTCINRTTVSRKQKLVHFILKLGLAQSCLHNFPEKILSEIMKAQKMTCP
jgi:hypothetical protein